jgi:hypothetical protein
MTDDDNGGDTSPLYDYAASQAKMLFCGDMGDLDRPFAPVELDDDDNNAPPLLDVGDRREAAWRARSAPATTDALGGSSDPDSSLSSPSQSSAAKRDLARLRGRLKQRSEPDALDRSWAASLGESPTKRSIAAEKVLHADWSDGGESTEEERAGAAPPGDFTDGRRRSEDFMDGRRRSLDPRPPPRRDDAFPEEVEEEADYLSPPPPPPPPAEKPRSASRRRSSTLSPTKSSRGKHPKNERTSPVRFPARVYFSRNRLSTHRSSTATSSSSARSSRRSRRCGPTCAPRSRGRPSTSSSG